MSATIDIAAEDCYAIIDPISEGEVAPHNFTMTPFGEAASQLAPWSVVWDFRQMGETLYRDVVDAYDAAARRLEPGAARPVALVHPGREADVEDAFREFRYHGKLAPVPRIVPAEARPIATRSFDLTPFEERWLELRDFPVVLGDAEIEDVEVTLKILEEELRRDGQKAAELGITSDETEAMGIVDALLADDEYHRSMERLMQDVEEERRGILSSFLTKIATNSLFSHIALHLEGDRIRVVPYHGHGVHNIEAANELIAVRPSRVGAVTQWARLAPAIARLEELLNTPGVKEGDIERLLRANPLFLRGLNYTNVYHQVVLPLTDGSYLKPDIIAEPVGGGWAEILDLKLPTETIYVGGGDRPMLSHAINKAARQLRSYARYFEDRAAAKRVEEKYGFRCYMPRQTVIIGRDPAELNDLQRDTVLTAYPHLRIVTYDELIRSAQELLLF
jgi:hypothetical protein